MALSAGVRLGKVEILSLIGAGGMGEVYRARDFHLKRDVAVKVLPGMFAFDADRVARFQREAELLATLNHPNIAAIYGIEDADGGHALLLELVEGPTLADRLSRGPIPVSEALSIARQIVDALDAAHERGIVHRDLKPANIKVRDDGVVKVLDFGLAKALEPRSAGAAASDLPTVTDLDLTRRGTIIGTAAYMSPEQARGQAVDKRTDIWAFGCVLYEMLAGHTAFGRSTVTDTLAAVVEQSPDWTALPRPTPPLAVRLLRRCLEKDVRRRLHDIADARLDLEDVDSSLSGNLYSPRARTRWMIAALSALAAVAATAALWSATRGTTATTPEPVRFSIDLGPSDDLPLDAGLPVPFALSRDGRSIVYVTRRASGNRVYLRRADGVDAAIIAGTEGGNGPFISPDGQWLGFASGGFIRKVPIQGGTPQNIAPVATLIGACWSDDGVIVFHEWQSGLVRVSADGGTREPLTRLDEGAGEISHQSPFCLPGGRAALFSTFRNERPPVIGVVDIPTGRRTELLEGSSPQYVLSGHLVFVRNGTLHAAPFDASRLDVTGPAVALADDMPVSVAQGRFFAMSLNGTLAYAPAAPATSRLVAVDPTGRSRSLVDGQSRFDHPRLSPDGARVVVSVFLADGGNEFWIHDLERNSRVRLSVSGPVSRPIWSPDGKSVTFQREGSLYSVPADESKAPEVLLARDASGSPLFPLAWSRHGPTLVFSRAAAGTNRDVFTLSAGRGPAPFLATTRDERSAMLSPDGRWMVYAALEAGREEEVYVDRYPDGGDRVVVSVGGGREPVWSPLGDEIFYRSTDGQQMMAVAVRTEPSLSVGRPRALFQGWFRTGLFWANYDVHPKTREFLMLAVDEPLRPRLIVAVNWTGALDEQ